MNKKAVFITPVNIFDNNGNGGAKASLEHLRMLQNYYGNENVYIIVFALPEEIPQIPLNKMVYVYPKLSGNIKLLFASLFGCRIYQPWEEKKIFKYIDEINPEIVFFDFSIEGRMLKRKSDYKTIVFFHNMEADYTYNKMKKEGFFYYPAYITAKRNDKWAAMADKVLCLNARDSERMNELYKRKSDLNIPISFKDSFDEKKAYGKYQRELLFLGSMFGPNQDGIEWFMEKVMPRLNNVTLNIVGLGFETKREEYEKYPNVNVIGTVDNPSDYYYSHSAVVMPIRYGAGMKVKTAEAMMYGRHIFASDEALEGYDVDNVIGIERCNEVEEYVNAINRYFDCEKKKTYETEVREVFLSKYESSKVYEDFSELLKSIKE